MRTKSGTETPASTQFDTISKLRTQYGCGPIEFAGTDNALYERHLVFDNVVDLAAVGPRERFEAMARSVLAGSRNSRTTGFAVRTRGRLRGRTRRLKSS